MNVIFTCIRTSKNAKDCNSFVSWTYGYKNYDGKSFNKLESWGNYNDVYKIGYGKPSGLNFNQSVQDDVENTINWQGYILLELKLLQVI